MTTTRSSSCGSPTSPAAPDPRFVAGLRNRLVAALDARPDLPTVALPERSTTMTDTATDDRHARDHGDVDAHAVPLRRPGGRRPSTGTSTCSAPSSRSATPATTAASATPS